MKVVFDTNMILNAAMGRPGYEEAQELIQAVVNEKISGLITANSITDIHYVVRKSLGKKLLGKSSIMFYLYLMLRL